jgi:hypothetical protein
VTFKPMLSRGFAWASAVCLVSGCGESTHPGVTLDQDAARAPDTVADAASADAGDPNGTFDRATELTVGAYPGVYDSLDGREDADFFSFEGTAGEWVAIRATDASGISVSDTPLNLFGPDRQRLAFNRYTPALLGETILARIITRLPADGRYYVAVVDPGAPSISWGYSQPYRISVADASTLDGFSINVEGDAPTATNIQKITTPSGDLDDVFLMGEFGTTGDTDAFSIDIPEGGARLVDAKVDTSGIMGNGSTSTPGDVWVTDTDGTTIIGRIDGAAGQTSLTPPLAAGRHLLVTDHPHAMALGTNDFFVIRALIAPDNPIEAEDATNGVIDTAEPLAVEALDPAKTQFQAYVLSHLGKDDVDYFRFDAKADQTADVSCISRGDGSGVVGLHLSARDEKDATLSEATEDVGTPIDLPSVTIPSSGAVYLRLSKDSQLDDVIGDWVRCVISSS